MENVRRRCREVVPTLVILKQVSSSGRPQVKAKQGNQFTEAWGIEYWLTAEYMTHRSQIKTELRNQKGRMPLSKEVGQSGNQHRPKNKGSKTGLVVQISDHHPDNVRGDGSEDHGPINKKLTPEVKTKQRSSPGKVETKGRTTPIKVGPVKKPKCKMKAQ